MPWWSYFLILPVILLVSALMIGLRRVFKKKETSPASAETNEKKSSAKSKTSWTKKWKESIYEVFLPFAILLGVVALASWIGLHLIQGVVNFTNDRPERQVVVRNETIIPLSTSWTSPLKDLYPNRRFRWQVTPDDIGVWLKITDDERYLGPTEFFVFPANNRSGWQWRLDKNPLSGKKVYLRVWWE